MKDLLLKIILSDNVVDNFYTAYQTNENFKNWIDKTIPEIADCEKQRQNNPWHKYNVLGHILHSIEQINKLSLDLSEHERLILATTMLFHDIGKPYTHVVREKDGKMIDSFFNHNIKSCEVARKRLPSLGFDEEEIKIIDKLIYKHDIFMFIKPFKTSNPHWRTLTESLIEDEIADFDEVGDGEHLLRLLLMVGRADNLAQNEKMTGEALLLLDKFKQMLDDFIKKTKTLPISNY